MNREELVNKNFQVIAGYTAEEEISYRASHKSNFKELRVSTGPQGCAPPREVHDAIMTYLRWEVRDRFKSGAAV